MAEWMVASWAGLTVREWIRPPPEALLPAGSRSRAEGLGVGGPSPRAWEKEGGGTEGQRDRGREREREGHMGPLDLPTHAHLQELRGREGCYARGSQPTRVLAGHDTTPLLQQLYRTTQLKVPTQLPPLSFCPSQPSTSSASSYLLFPALHLQYAGQLIGQFLSGGGAFLIWGEGKEFDY